MCRIPPRVRGLEIKCGFTLREIYEICLEREKQLKAGKKMRLEEFGLCIIESFKATYRRLFAQYYVDHFNSHGSLAPKLDVLQAIHLIAKAWDSIPSAHCWQQVGIVNAMDRDLVGKYEKYLEDIQMATTISVAHMLVKRRITG